MSAIGPASPSPPTEAYALMWYGETRSRSFDGLKVVVQSVRSFDANREIVLMTPVKDPEARTHDPMLLALQQSIPRVVIERVPLRTIFRNTSVTCTDRRGKQCGSKGSRSYVFTYSKFGLWNLTRWSRLMYLDIDLLVTRSLEPLWEARIGAGNEFVAASYAIKAKTGKNPVGGQKAEFPCNGKSRGWHQAIGYNTGLLLLQPSQIVAEAIFHEMKNSWRWSFKSPCRSDQTYFNILFDRYVPLTRCFPYSANCRDPKFINSSSAPDPNATVSKLSRCLEPLGGEGGAAVGVHSPSISRVIRSRGCRRTATYSSPASGESTWPRSMPRWVFPSIPSDLLIGPRREHRSLPIFPLIAPRWAEPRCHHRQMLRTAIASCVASKRPSGCSSSRVIG